MELHVFKAKLDSRGPFLYDEMWPAAYKWEAEINNTPANETMEWSWDCNLKLDYDGEPLSLSSRFYPPHKSHSDYGKYHGTVSMYFGDYYCDGRNDLVKKEIEADTLDELVEKVEVLVGRILNLTKSILFENKHKFDSL